MPRGDLHKAEADALAKRMIESVRRHREEKRQMELSTEKCGTIQS